MSYFSYSFTLADGRKVNVNVPDKVSIDATSRDDARASIAAYIFEQLTPKLAPLPMRRKLTRDATGTIDGTLEYPSVPGDQLAAAIAASVAWAVMPAEADDA